MSEARTVRDSHSVETSSSVRRTYGFPPDSPSIQTRTLKPDADARKKTWISRLDWTFGTNGSLTTDNGALGAVNLRLPCPRCAILTIDRDRARAGHVRLQPPARGDYANAGARGYGACF